MCLVWRDDFWSWLRGVGRSCRVTECMGMSVALGGTFFSFADVVGRDIVRTYAGELADALSCPNVGSMLERFSWVSGGVGGDW